MKVVFACSFLEIFDLCKFGQKKNLCLKSEEQIFSRVWQILWIFRNKMLMISHLSHLVKHPFEVFSLLIFVLIGDFVVLF